MSREWIRVSHREPCRICGKGDWCTVSGDSACCMRVESDTPMKNGGWLHRLADPAPRAENRKPERPPAPPPDFAAMHEAWLKRTTLQEIEDHARGLGVSALALEELGAAWAWQHSAWAWPMKDGAGRIAGIRLRDVGGRKWAVPGSHQGVFVPCAWPDMPREAVICEGPTDTAAALSIGLLGIGRPSCLGCEVALIETLKRMAVRRVIIAADHDGPGLAGAKKLAAQIRIPWKIIMPPEKDMRAWVAAGATRDLFECVVSQQIWRMP